MPTTKPVQMIQSMANMVRGKSCNPNKETSLKIKIMVAVKLALAIFHTSSILTYCQRPENTPKITKAITLEHNNTGRP